MMMDRFRDKDVGDSDDEHVAKQEHRHIRRRQEDVDAFERAKNSPLTLKRIWTLAGAIGTIVGMVVSVLIWLGWKSPENQNKADIILNRTATQMVAKRVERVELTQMDLIEAIEFLGFMQCEEKRAKEPTRVPPRCNSASIMRFSSQIPPTPR